jgi:phosphoribosyl 1,2-cyclic phosphodiesterase
MKTRLRRDLQADKAQGAIMRIIALASGSSGNAYLVVSGSSHVLFDAGLPAPLLERYLRAYGVAARQLSAIFVSHEHTDHLCGAGALARRYRLPVFATAGTLRAGAAVLGPLPDRRELAPGGTEQVGALLVRTFPVAHDAAEPVGFRVSGDGTTIGLCTDLGQITPVVRGALAAADLLVIEANHDHERLWNGPYPWPLKRRVAGPTGHLSNSDTAEFVQALAQERPPHTVWLAHLSATNNTPALARGAVRTALAAVGQSAIPVEIVGRDRPSLSWDGTAPAPARQLALPW